MHVPHNPNMNATDDANAETAARTLGVAVSVADNDPDVRHITIGADTNAPVELVCKELQRAYPSWQMHWTTSEGVSMMHGEHGQRVDLVLQMTKPGDL